MDALWRGMAARNGVGEISDIGDYQSYEVKCGAKRQGRWLSLVKTRNATFEANDNCGTDLSRSAIDGRTR